MGTAVITPPWYSLQEANIVSFLTELEVRVGGGGPTYQLCPLTKRSARESLRNVCPCTLVWALHLGPPPQPGFNATTAGCTGLPALHPSPGQSGMQAFISWLGCFLTEKKERETVFSQLHPPSAAAWCGARTRLSSAGIIGDEPLPRLSGMNRAAQASQVCLCLCCPQQCPSLHPVAHWYPLPRFFCWHLGIEIVRDTERWSAGKLSCHEGIVSMKFIQVLFLKTQIEGGWDSRDLLALLPGSILPQWMSVCEHLWRQFINTSN